MQLQECICSIDSSLVHTGLTVGIKDFTKFAKLCFEWDIV